MTLFQIEKRIIPKLFSRKKTLFAFNHLIIWPFTLFYLHFIVYNCKRRRGGGDGGGWWWWWRGWRLTGGNEKLPSFTSDWWFLQTAPTASQPMGCEASSVCSRQKIEQLFPLDGEAKEEKKNWFPGIFFLCFLRNGSLLWWATWASVLQTGGDRAMKEKPLL